MKRPAAGRSDLAMSAETFQFFFVALPFIIIFLPWPLAWRSWLAIAETAICLFLLYPEPGNPGAGYAFGLTFLGYLYLTISVFLIFRFLVFRASTRNKPPIIKIHENILNALNITLAAYTGALLSLFVAKFFLFAFSGTDHGYVIHDSLAKGAFIFAILFLILPFIKKKSTSITIISVALFSAGISITTISFLGKRYPEIVIANAKEIAGNNPYCIELYKRKRPLQSLEDLTLYTMDKNRYVNHVILIVKQSEETVPFHWSYELLRFEQGAYGWDGREHPQISCSPSLGFADKIPSRAQ